MGLSSLPLRWVFFAFHFYLRSFGRGGLLLCVASSLRGPRRGCLSQVKPESWHHRCQASVCSSVASVCSSVLSRHNKDLERRTLKPLARHSSRVLDKRVTAFRRSGITALFYLEDSRRIHPRSIRACQPKDVKRREWGSTPVRGREGGGERERDRERARERAHACGGGQGESPLVPLFMFLPPPGLPCANWATQECCSFYLKSSLGSSDLPLTFLCSIFAGFSRPCLLATAILDSCFLF